MVDRCDAFVVQKGEFFDGNVKQSLVAHITDRCATVDDKVLLEFGEQRCGSLSRNFPAKYGRHPTEVVIEGRHVLGHRAPHDKLSFPFFHVDHVIELRSVSFPITSCECLVGHIIRSSQLVDICDGMEKLVLKTAASHRRHTIIHKGSDRAHFGFIVAVVQNIQLLERVIRQQETVGFVLKNGRLQFGGEVRAMAKNEIEQEHECLACVGVRLQNRGVDGLFGEIGEHSAKRLELVLLLFGIVFDLLRFADVVKFTPR